MNNYLEFLELEIFTYVFVTKALCLDAMAKDHSEKWKSYYMVM